MLTLLRIERDDGGEERGSGRGRGWGRGDVVARVERWISTDSDAESRG
jgi:hypothetical protein